MKKDWLDISAAPKSEILLGRDEHRERLFMWSDDHGRFIDVDKRAGILLPFTPKQWRFADDDEIKNTVQRYSR